MEKFHCDFIQAYGATESGGFSSYLLPEDHVFDDSDTKIWRLAPIGRETILAKQLVMIRKGKKY